MIDVIHGTGVLESVCSEGFAIGDGLPNQGHCRPASSRRYEVNAVIGENGMDFVGCGCDESEQELACNARGRFVMQLGESKFRGPVDSNEEIEFALRGTDFGDVDMEVTDGIGLVLASYPLFVLHVGQTRVPVTLKTTVKR